MEITINGQITSINKFGRSTRLLLWITSTYLRDENHISADGDQSLETIDQFVLGEEASFEC